MGHLSCFYHDIYSFIYPLIAVRKGAYIFDVGMTNSKCLIKCPACGRISGETEILVQSARGISPWRRCDFCKAYFLAQTYDEAREIIHTGGMSWGKEDSALCLNEFKKRMFLFILCLLRRYCPPPARLLDVGCSYGGFLIEANNEGYQVSGSDILAQATEYVKSQGIPAETVFSINQLKSIDEGTLDIVSCLDSNYYWSDQPAELAFAHCKLKPNGYLVMRVVDKSWMFSCGLLVRRISSRLGQKIISTAMNDHRFSMPLSSLLAIIKKSGFEIIYVSPRGAIHSHKTRFLVKLFFAFGIPIWFLGGIMIAPGALILARKLK